MNKVFEMLSKLFRKRKIQKGFIEVTHGGTEKKVALNVSVIAMIDYNEVSKKAEISLLGTQYKDEYYITYKVISVNETIETVLQLIREAQK